MSNKTPEQIQKEKDEAAAAELAKKAKKARVLVDTTIGETAYKANDVDTFSAAEIAAHKGALDADPATVKYAESLKKKPAED